MITLNDSTLEQIRDIRHQISENNNHNPYQLIAYYLELQQKHKLQKTSVLREVVGTDQKDVQSTDQEF